MQKNKNAIVFLLNAANKDINNFRQSLPLLHHHYLAKHNCEVICFYEKNFPKEEIEFLTDNSPAPLIFQEVDFKMPNYAKDLLESIPDFVPHPLFPQVPGFPMGYRHMCRFYAGEIFKQELLDDYEYVWRLDTDSFILQAIEGNVFEDMSNANAVYGYINIQHDHPKMVKGLWELAATYFKPSSSSIFTPEAREKHFQRVFYTNFEIYNMKWFKGAAYQDFYNHIDNSAGIYKYRWGDHAIRYLGLHGLGAKDKCLFFKDIVYQHGEVYHNRRIVNNF